MLEIETKLISINIESKLSKKKRESTSFKSLYLILLL